MSTHYINVTVSSNPSYMDLYSFEKDFPIDYWRTLFINWGWLSIPISIVYVILVFSGKAWMSSRPPFKLNRFLTLWNVILAIMSIMATVRGLPEHLQTMARPNGFHNSICEWKHELHNGATAFWALVLVLSKVVELGDTGFVILRKQRLLFLHWYHHITTLMSWWFMYPWYEPVQNWFGGINSFVHSFMYSYYALKSLKINPPRPVAMFITSLQLGQMLLMVGLSVYSAWIMAIHGPESCPHRSWFGLKVGFAIYIPYSILFGKLFIDSYISPKKKEGGMKKAE